MFYCHTPVFPSISKVTQEDPNKRPVKVMQKNFLKAISHTQCVNKSFALLYIPMDTSSTSEANFANYIEALFLRIAFYTQRKKRLIKLEEEEWWNRKTTPKNWMDNRMPGNRKTWNGSMIAWKTYNELGKPAQKVYVEVRLQSNSNT